MPVSADDIQILIRGCQQNDRIAQERLYRKFYAVMMAICMRYAKDKSDAVEMLNDGYLKVFKNIGQYDVGKSSLYTWMRKIMINTSLDFLRKLERRTQTDAISSEEEEPAIESEVLSKMDAEEILVMIRQLSDSTRYVFNLYAIDGFSHREIAEMMQISEGTSRWHLSEARRELKTIIHLMKNRP